VCFQNVTTQTLCLYSEFSWRDFGKNEFIKSTEARSTDKCKTHSQGGCQITTMVVLLIDHSVHHSVFATCGL
jgi:hypothetical protein